MRTTLKIAVLAAVPLLALLGCPSDGPKKPSAQAQVAKSDPAKTPADGDARKATFVVSGMS